MKGHRSVYDFKPDAALAADERYRELLGAADALTADEPDAVANMANVAALMWEFLPDLNWAGFYRVAGAKKGAGAELVLGPFMGARPASAFLWARGCAERPHSRARPSGSMMSTPSPAISSATLPAGRNWWCRCCVMAR